MYTGLIASRYASALAEFSAANGDEERTYDEVRRLIGLYRRDRSLRDVLFSPSSATRRSWRCSAERSDGR